MPQIVITLQMADQSESLSFTSAHYHILIFYKNFFNSKMYKTIINSMNESINNIINSSVTNVNQSSNPC